MNNAWGKPVLNLQQDVINARNAWMIRTSWEILKCMYSELRQRKFGTFQIDNIYNMDSLYQAIIAHWCQQLLKEGLFKGYVEHENEELQSPQGQINVQETIQRQTTIRGQMVCTYDELSDNVHMNHILKGTLQYIMQLNTVQENVKREIKKVIVKFQGMDQVDIQNLKWNTVRYNNNTIRYKNLLSLCHWLYMEKQFSKHSYLPDDIRVYNLFKKGLYSIIVSQFGDIDTVTEYKNDYVLSNEPEFETALLEEQEYAVVQIKDLQLIYMVRLMNQDYYGKDFHIQRKKQEEMYGTLRKYEDTFRDNAVGAILIINLNPQDYSVDNMNINMIERHAMGEITIDLWDKWDFILTRIKTTYDYFIQRKKERDSK